MGNNFIEAMRVDVSRADLLDKSSFEMRGEPLITEPGRPGQRTKLFPHGASRDMRQVRACFYMFNRK